MKTSNAPETGVEATAEIQSISELVALKRAAQEPVLRAAGKRVRALIMDLRK